MWKKREGCYLERQGEAGLYNGIVQSKFKPMNKFLLLCMLLTGCSGYTELDVSVRNLKTGMPGHRHWMPDFDGIVRLGDTIEVRPLIGDNYWYKVERIDTIK